MDAKTAGEAGGTYAPIEVAAPAEAEPIAEAVAVPEQFVEVVAPADLAANYELTVQLGDSTSVVLVVSYAVYCSLC